ncbi:MAG: hypothetical protein R3250_04020 [Melioribacteraceae bacterium]|nr:hypothetical protein [Melioribacteraceae bacterium]
MPQINIYVDNATFGKYLQHDEDGKKKIRQKINENAKRVINQA